MNEDRKFWLQTIIIGVIMSYIFEWTFIQWIYFAIFQFVAQQFIFKPLNQKKQQEKNELEEKQRIKNQRPVTGTTSKTKSTKKKPIKKQNNTQKQVLYSLKSEEEKKFNLNHTKQPPKKKRKNNQNKSLFNTETVENHINKKRQNKSIPESFSIKDKKILIVGGKEKWFKQFIEKELEGELFHIEQDKSHKNSNIDFVNLDAVFIYLKFVDHDSTIIPIRKAKESNVPLFFIKRGRGEIKEVLWNQFKEEIS